METPATHVIGKQVFHFRIPAEANAADLQRICNDELPARLTALFDRLCAPDTVMRIPKLHLKLQLPAGAIDLENLSRQIVEETERNIVQFIAENPSSVTTAAEHAYEVLRFYLTHGFRPAWSTYNRDVPLSTVLDACTDVCIEALQQSFCGLSDGPARRRLAALLESKPADIGFLARWTHIPQPKLETVLERIGSSTGEPRKLNVNATLAELLTLEDWTSMDHPEMRSQRLLSLGLDAQLHRANTSRMPASAPGKIPIPQPLKGKHLWYVGNSPGILPGRAPEAMVPSRWTGVQARLRYTPRYDPFPVPPENQRIRIYNAGLVLVAPYLPMLFEHVGISAAGRLSDPALAIALLRSIVFGSNVVPEDACVLDKIICGLELAVSPGELPVPGEAAQLECEAMLQSMIATWSALKQVSADGLRAAFLQRDGLLRFSDGHWRLRVQRQAMDVLLDAIPWSYSVIHLPWMRDTLFVEWSA